MSLEGRMGMSAPQPKQPGTSAVFESTSLFKGATKEHHTTKEFQESHARKLLQGLLTPEELAVKYGPAVMDEVMKTAERISAYESFSGNETLLESPEPRVREPHPLTAIIPSVLEHYTDPDRSEEDEQEYLDLLQELKTHDETFKTILGQYDALIKLYPDRTEEYEMKAMKDFVEYNARLQK